MAFSPQSLFNDKEIRRKVGDLPMVRSCRVCGIENSTPLTVEGEGRKHILIVFGQPNEVQWECRSWFADTAQQVYQAIIYQGGDPGIDTAVTGVLPCRGTKDPLKYEQCLVGLANTISRLNPSGIITVGEVATGAVLRLYNPYHYPEGFTAANLYGQQIPLVQERGWQRWLCPLMSEERMMQFSGQEVQEVAKQWTFRYAARAYEICKKAPPLIKKPEIELLVDPADIIKGIEQAIESELTAFDYETNSFDPWRQHAKLLTSSLAMGTQKKLERTIAFHMSDKNVVEKWKEYLRSGVKKIGANIMFEHYWSTVFLNTPVVNWVWDTCLGARIMDCDHGVSNLKRTTFVNLGVIGYDDVVDSFMDTETEEGINSLEKMNQMDLLTYNAYDSAYTYLCALRQRKFLNVVF